MGIVIRNISELFRKTDIEPDDVTIFRRPSAPGATKDYGILVSDLVTVIAELVPPGQDGREIELQNSGTHIQWRYSGDLTWNDLVALTEITGPQGIRGDSGISAYEAAVNNGFVGSESQWLVSLIGNQGPQGSQGIQGIQGVPGNAGISAYQVAVNNGFVGTESQWLASLIGSQGIKGDKGDQGIQGEKGDTGSQGIRGNDGLSAYQVAVANGFIGTQSQWLVSLIGPQGNQGIQGDKGDQGNPGVGVSTLSNDIAFDFGSSNGDTVVNTIFSALITSSNIKGLTIIPLSNSDHQAEDYALENISCQIENVVDGVSFDLRLTAPNGTWGQYLLKYIVNY